MKNSKEFPQKIKKRAIIWSRNSDYSIVNWIQIHYLFKGVFKGKFKGKINSLFIQVNIYSKGMKSGSQDTCTPIFTVDYL